MYPHYHTHISTSSNTCIHFIEYVYSHHRTRISVLHFVGVYVYAGTINRTPTAADDLQQRCEQIAIYTRTPTKHHTFAPQKPYFRTTNTILLHHKNHTFTPQIPYFYTTNTILLHHKYHTFTPQIPYFYTTNTILSHYKNHTFTPQKPYFYTTKTYRRQIGRVAKTFC